MRPKQHDTMRRGRRFFGTLIAILGLLSLAGCSTENLGAPAELSGSSGDGSASLSWAPVDGAVGYRVLMHTSSGLSATTYTEARETGNTEFVWSGLTNGTASYFAVAAISSEGVGPLSGEIAVTPFAPLSSESTSELAPDIETAGGQHGLAVATDGSFAAVGSPGQVVDGYASGAVFVYERTADGWSAPAVLSPPSPSGAELFGIAVSISGDTLVVGASGWTNAFFDTEGRAFVYERGSGNDWSFSDSLSAGANAENGAEFGKSVATSGEYVVVGAPSEDEGATADAGAAYVFVRGTTDWGTGERLARSSTAPAENDSFGESVAIDGDYLLVGIPGAEYSTFTNPGTAEVYRRTGVNTWSFSDDLIASDAFTDEGTFTPDNERFGDAVAIDGTMLVVGAPYDSEFSNRAGAVHVYYRTGEDAHSDGFKLLAPDASEGSWFGASVSIRDGWLAVGAPRADVPGYASAGAAYVYKDEGSGAMLHYEKLAAPVPQATAKFGTSVAIGQSGLIAGEPDVDGGEANSGTAYAFE